MPVIECKKKCGGAIIWKSRLGGWMIWAFDIKTETESGNYRGDLESNYFESTRSIDGSSFVPVDYTSVNLSNTKNLTDLSLTNSELDAVRGIAGSMAVYFVKENGDLELMKVTSSSVPKSNLIGGGNFSVTLKSISGLTFNVR